MNVLTDPTSKSREWKIKYKIRGIELSAVVSGIKIDDALKNFLDNTEGLPELAAEKFIVSIDCLRPEFK